MAILVTGGCGYIGSHILQNLQIFDQEVICLDALITGKVERVPNGTIFIEGNILDEDKVHEIFRDFKIKQVIHLAALKSISESRENPALYNKVNIQGTRVILEASIRYGVERFILASSAAVYGIPENDVVTENSKLQPISLYGQTKLESEILLNNCIESGEISGSSLRLFNVAGAESTALIDTSNSNLISIVTNSIQKNKVIQIFGDDFDTRDGSCIRDFVHVSDVADAFVKSTFLEGEPPLSINIGSGVGTSVFQIIKLVESALELPARIKIAERRQGEVAKIIADLSVYTNVLSSSQRRTIESIIRSGITAI